MPKEKRPRIKNEDQYEALRDQGYSKEKSARIANTPDQVASKKGGKAPAYEEWTVKELYEKAREIGLSGISKLRKKELIERLRNH
ncbi:DUF7218 family protein [Cyclobacterium jeungdonense]|uniref:Rho termination factor N-terminal domain-containing protein n=1 Tax=Cyclobacterium jeungdonense TaxID=708087 RepID=A0ABT8CER7_9BACT|nr:Rho termination factor N-terminal domain-containing protein [Cyclobacterium jeungdonense]MDN3690682.1 Rho termination factor N-terminal domain-containing protein [Cyclobacterium jeungdonense]